MPGLRPGILCSSIAYPRTGLRSCEGQQRESFEMAKGQRKTTAGAPSKGIVEAMARDAKREHEKPFQLKRDVSYPGNLREDATFTYFASEEEGEGYYCAICMGRTMIAKLPYGTPERNALARRRNPEIWGLAHDPPEQLEEITVDFDRGLYARAARAEVARAKQRQTKRRGRDARSASRIENAQAWMLKRYAEIGHRETVWEELGDLLQTDPRLHRKLIGDDRPTTFGTAKRWWDEIDVEERRAAKATYNQRPVEERKHEAAARRRTR